MKTAPCIFETQEEMMKYNKKFVNDNLWGPIVEEILSEQCAKQGFTYDEFVTETEKRFSELEKVDKNKSFKEYQLFMWEKLHFDISDLIEYNNKRK